MLANKKVGSKRMKNSKNRKLTCFKAYDIRGELNVDFDEEICRRIGKAFSEVLLTKEVVVGRDARESSYRLQENLMRGLSEQGTKIIDIGLCGTEEVYCAVSEYKACGGLMVTASHNPVNYNGIKMVKADSKPLDPKSELLEIKKSAEQNSFKKKKERGHIIKSEVDARKKYVDIVLKFLDIEKLDAKKVLVNCGNGAAGPTFNAIEGELKNRGVNLEFEKVFFEPDSSFPNGIPNPLIKENQELTKKKILESGASLGIAFDGDFDRCFFFDERGQFVNGEYIMGILAEEFLSYKNGGVIVHDPRRIWNVQDVICKFGGKSVVSKTGHAYVKQTMRMVDAIYGGEISAHHYFKDFFYCDSGMIPWLLILQLLTRKKKNLSQVVDERKSIFLSSDEINIVLDRPDDAIKRIKMAYNKKAVNKDNLDGLSYAFENWRFNLRKSNTEQCLRLNVEIKSKSELLKEKVDEVLSFIQGRH